MKTHFQIAIIGGGNAGISVAAQLLNKQKTLDIAIFDPSEKHYYQPAWTLVGGGVFDIKKTERSEKSVIPKNAKWIQESVETFDPENQRFKTKNGNEYSYDILIVAPGIQLNWNAIPGLEDSLGKNGVSSNYSFKHASYTFELIQNLKKGKAIFHNPDTPVKCGGAPHKIMYLAADYFRKHGVLKDISIEYWSGAAKLFAVPHYEKTLLEVVKRGNIHLHLSQKLLEIDGPNQRAFFAPIGEDPASGSWVDYDMLHVVPPQSAPDFISQSSLANSAGWVDINPGTLQHNHYSTIFSLGDAAGLPTSKTGAAIRKQAPVLVQNVLSILKNQQPDSIYNGYTSCPLVTGYGKLVLAEFDYKNEPQETFPFDQSKERWSMYQLKKQVLPWMYWNKILTGKA